jgi:hypothetical protein
MQRIGMLWINLQYLLVNRLSLRQTAGAMMCERALKCGLSRCARRWGSAGAFIAHAALLVFLAAAAGTGIVATGTHDKPRLANLAFLVFIIKNFSRALPETNSTETRPCRPREKIVTARSAECDHTCPSTGCG